MQFNRCKDRKIRTHAREAAQRASARPAPRGFAHGAVALLAGALTLASGLIWAQNLTAPPSLKTIAVPEPANLSDYVKNKATAIALGKALFWDMQVGSDSVQACASCHFHAGADNRVKGQINSGINGGDTTPISVANTVNGTLLGQNAEVTVDSFPLHKLFDPLMPTDPLVNPANIERTTHATALEPSRSGDVLSSMGVSRFKLFGDIPAIGAASFVPPGSSGVSSLRADYACGDPTAPANIALCVPPA